jgi:hypothetical protein
MNILINLPKEIKNIIFLFIQHPIAEIISESIKMHRCDDDRDRSLYNVFYFYEVAKVKEYKLYITYYDDEFNL